ncbi:hypothetical protein QN362_17665 [Actimicrobium sp. CCC2.4]|uniref:hypothetical protein n=1 Tax=Actimicrobium sp. CCC2.4 TaxID=3048606 RepID=UPI002AC8CBEB|nr:hypothetical protein [Actimicrobium sp. CCC2.4]MEB0137163.1 hypothetical protein [Actimicrobium sp. CCC2.4]WPX30904.1 hypothetical protein RHM62_11585 [Actimicrobium sp. CCC2.4]
MEKEKVPNECQIKKEQSFSLTAGPLAVVFEDGSILGVASDPRINSVIVWLDQSGDRTNTTQMLSEDPELFPIRASDHDYSEPSWGKFYQHTLIGFSIIKSKNMSVAENELPSELGLRIYFDNTENFIASHGLHNGSDDFSVLMECKINPVIRQDLEELPLLK